MFEEYWISTLSHKNSQEFQEAPQATCEDCLYEMREWEEQQEVSRKTNSLHERELKTLKETCRSLESEKEHFDKETSMNDVCEGNIDKDDEHELLSGDKNNEEPEKCPSYTSFIPHIVLSGTYTGCMKM